MSDHSTMNLYQKLAAITGELGAIAKDGKSGGYGDNYTFIEYGAIAARIRSLFAKYGVVIVPYMKDGERTMVKSSKGKDGVHAIIPFVFVVRNADKPDEKFSVTWYGESIDYGDKATNKAATAALKYYLMRQFNISEKGDDPDADSPEAGQAVAKKAKAVEAASELKTQLAELMKQMSVTDEEKADFFQAAIGKDSPSTINDLKKSVEFATTQLADEDDAAQELKDRV